MLPLMFDLSITLFLCGETATCSGLATQYNCHDFLSVIVNACVSGANTKSTATDLVDNNNK